MRASPGRWSVMVFVLVMAAVRDGSSSDSPCNGVSSTSCSAAGGGRKGDLASTVSHTLLQVAGGSRSARGIDDNGSQPDGYETCRLLAQVHIPKNAGVSVILAGWERKVFWNIVDNILYMPAERIPASLAPVYQEGWGVVIPPSGIRCLLNEVPQDLFGSLGVIGNPYSDFIKQGGEIFCLKRNPYSRLVSEYKFEASRLLAKKVEGLIVPVEDVASLQLFGKPICSADGLNEFVQKALSAFQGGNSYVMDCHIMPQTMYMSSKDGAACTNVIAVEELPGSFDTFMERKGCPIRLGASKSNEGRVCLGLSADNLTKESKRLIQAVYREDFRLLNYTL